MHLKINYSLLQFNIIEPGREMWRILVMTLMIGKVLLEVVFIYWFVWLED